MLNCISLLSDNYAHFKNEPAAHMADGIRLSFLATGSSSSMNLREAYEFFSRNNLTGFSLSFRIHTRIDNSLLQDMIAFFFIPAYCKINGNLLVNLICNDSSVFEHSRTDILNYCGEQGITNLLVNHLIPFEPGYPQPENSNHPVSWLFHNTTDLMADYRKRLQSGSIYNNLFHFTGSVNERSRLYEMAEQEEAAVKATNPGLYEMAVHTRSVLSENEYLKKKNSGMMNELDNYKSHIDILKSSHQANELQQYYNREYEALPLWYKRFGHIIKVITGKRSFRSLFNNKIKKQKD